MPQIGWLCANTNEAISFADCIECSRQGGHPRGGCPFTPEILIGIRNTVQPRTASAIYVTRIIGCTRQRIISAFYNYYVSPKKQFWAFRGVMAHEIVARARRRETWIELPYQRHIIINGVQRELSARADVIIPHAKTLLDYKSTKRVPKGDTIYGSHELQVNMYRWVYWPIVQIEHLRLVYFDMNEVKRIPVPVQPLEEIEEFIITSASRYLHHVDTRTLPKGGYDKNKWECRYCDVMAICRDLGIDGITDIHDDPNAYTYIYTGQPT